MAPVILLLKSPRVLIDGGKLPEESLAHHKVFELPSVLAVLVREVRLIREKRPDKVEHFASAGDVAQPSFRKDLCQLGTALDGFLELLVRGVESLRMA